MVTRGRRSENNGKGEVLEEPIWGDVKFPIKVANYPQQDHANKRKVRAGRAFSHQRFEKGGFIVSLEVGWCHYSNCVLSLQYWVCYFGLLLIYKNFRMSLSIVIT